MLAAASSKRALMLCAPAVVLAAAACTDDAPPPEEARPRPVKYVEVAAQSGARTRTFTGFAKADTRSEVSFRVTGTMQRVYVEQGDLMEKGDLIAEVDPVDFEIQVREIEASLAEAKARYVLANSEFQRIQRLYEKDNASQGDFDSALAKRESARAGVESVEHQLERARRQIEYTRLKVPFTGVVVVVKIEEGESVQAGAPVVEVATGEKPQVEIAVPEVAVADIYKGDSAKIRFSAVPGRTFMGRVATLGVVPSEGVTTYPVTIELNRSWEQLDGISSPIRPGMAVEAEMQFGAAGGLTHVVPANAVVADREGKFVYIVEDAGDGTGNASKRSVETGRLVPAGLEVVSGLSEGEKVITAGLNRIKDRQPVRLLPQD